MKWAIKRELLNNLILSNIKGSALVLFEILLFSADVILPYLWLTKLQLRKVPLSLSPSCATQKKTAREKSQKKMAARIPSGENHAKDPFRSRLAPRISRGHFFPRGLLTVSLGISKRGTTGSLSTLYSVDTCYLVEC